MRGFYGFLGLTCALLSTASAQAWNPNEGAQTYVTQPVRKLPSSVVPSRYYSDNRIPATVPAATVNVIPPSPSSVAPPAPTLTYAPAPPSPAYVPAPPAQMVEVQPALRQVPVEQPSQDMTQSAATPYVATTPAYHPMAPKVYAAPAYSNEPSSVYATPSQSYANKASTRNHYSVGIEAFYDHYEEPDTFPDLHTEAYYGALTGSMTHYFDEAWFGTFEGRASYGSSDYASNSGSVDDISDYEFDIRFLAGYDVASGDSHFKPYFGIGSRVYLDYFKDEDIPGTYDRRIYQFYAPLGMTYEFTSGGLTYAPTIEIDPLLYGYVQSRLQAIPGFSQASNNQSSGIGWRAEFMISQIQPDGSGWQFGPFFRYWDIDDSDPDYSAGAFEPYNTRLQLGTKLKFLF